MQWPCSHAAPICAMFQQSATWLHNQKLTKQHHTFPKKLAVTGQLWVARQPHDHAAAVEPSMGHNYRCPNDQGGIAEEDPLQTEGHWGSTGTCSGKEVNGVPLQLFQEGNILRIFLRRSYSETEVLTSKEGCMSLDERSDPRLLRKPRHKRKQERDILLMPWA